MLDLIKTNQNQWEFFFSQWRKSCNCLKALTSLTLSYLNDGIMNEDLFSLSGALMTFDSKNSESIDKRTTWEGRAWKTIFRIFFVVQGFYFSSRRWKNERKVGRLRTHEASIARTFLHSHLSSYRDFRTFQKIRKVFIIIASLSITVQTTTVIVQRRNLSMWMRYQLWLSFLSFVLLHHRHTHTHTAH